jgi:hypothetical protein
MKRWRELLIIAALFATLIVFTVYTSRDRVDQQGPLGSVHSAADDGTLGLQRWLQTLGYTTDVIEYTAWQLPDDAAMLFMIAPDLEPITDEEAEETLRWVRNGGTLVLVVPRPAFTSRPNRLLERLRAEVVSPADAQLIARAAAVQPLLTNPPVRSVPVETETALRLSRDDYLPLLATPLGYTLVGLRAERGYVYIASGAYPFTNRGLRETDSTALILNLLARAPHGARVLFDEYHHGYMTPPSLRRILWQHWWGRAMLYALLVTGGYIILTGRRFGWPVPLPQDVTRRSSAEYVQSLALLFRRAGKRSYVLSHYHDQLKRRLARPYGFAPPADDAEFIRALQRFGGATGEQAERLQTLLAQLKRDAGEEHLIQLVRAADAFADEKGRIR